MAPHTPRRSERPGGVGVLLDIPTRSSLASASRAAARFGDPHLVDELISGGASRAIYID